MDGHAEVSWGWMDSFSAVRWEGMDGQTVPQHQWRAEDGWLTFSVFVDFKDTEDKHIWIASKRRAPIAFVQDKWPQLF